MKRSDAVKLMMHTYQSLHLGGWAEASEEEKMSVVLEALELVGMLPPGYLGDSYYAPEWEELKLSDMYPQVCTEDNSDITECEKEATTKVESTHCRGIECEFCLPDTCPFCKDKPCRKSWCIYTKGCK